MGVLNEEHNKVSVFFPDSEGTDSDSELFFMGQALSN